MMNHLEAVRMWLEKSCIVAPNDWIEACLEWIQEQNQGDSLHTDQLNNLVYEQWLMADLRELNTCCLPREVTTATKSHLTGNYPLQINSCVDAGTPYYGQLQKERGTENANCLVSGDQTFQPAWQPKPSRMLMLKLTDGTTDVVGMEYQHIPQLKTVVPGTKVLVHGRVLCRRGVLMLKSENVQVLGGEVDSLIETNTAENSLQLAMQENLAHANKSEKCTFSGRVLSEGKSKEEVKCENFSQPQRISHVQQVKNEARCSARSVRDTNQPANRLSWQLKNDVKKEENHSQHFEKDDTGNRQPNPENFEWCEDLEDVFMDEMDDFDIEDDVGQSSSTTYRSPVTNSKSNFGSSNSNCTSSKSNFGSSFTRNHQQDRFTSADSGRGEKRGSEMRRQANTCPEDDFEDDFDMEELEMVELTELCSQSSDQTVTADANTKIKLESSHTFQCEVSNQHQSVNSVKTCFDYNQTGEEKKTNNQPVLVKRERCLDSQSKTHLFSKDSSLLSGVENITESNSTKHSVSPPKQSSEVADIQLKANVPRAVIHPLKKNKPSVQFTMEQFVDSSPQSSNHQEFTYLSHILKQHEPGKTFIIKGYISTLTSKLTSKHGQNWQLSCKINDGSAVADVQLSDKVLTELIGFSASESVEMRLRAKTDASVKDILTEGLQQCQQQLVQLSCLVEIQFGCKAADLCVLRFIPVNKQHTLTLTQNVLHLSHNSLSSLH